MNSRLIGPLALALAFGLFLPEPSSAECQQPICDFECEWAWFNGIYLYHCELVCTQICPPDIPPGGNPDPPSSPQPDPVCAPTATIDTAAMTMYPGSGPGSVSSPIPCVGRWGNEFEITGQVQSYGTADVDMWMRYTDRPGLYTTLPTVATTLYSSGRLTTYQPSYSQAQTFQYEIKARLECPDRQPQTLTEHGSCNLRTAYTDDRWVLHQGAPVEVASRTLDGEKTSCSTSIYTFNQNHSVSSSASGSFSLAFLASDLGVATTSTIPSGYQLSLPPSLQARVYAQALQENHQYETFNYDWLGQPGPVLQAGTLHHRTLTPDFEGYGTCQ